MKQLICHEKAQCRAALISSFVVVVCVCIGVTMNLTTIYDQNFDHMGIRTFCMFTVLSNILSAWAMTQILPYTVDGLRKNNYHLPNWVVTFAYAAVTSVTLTFLISLFVLSPVKGFRLIFTGSRFFLHGVCPLLAFFSFCFFISDHRIHKKTVLYSMIPVFLYSIVYYVMVVVIGQSRGGWNDFYGFATRLPIWVSAPCILALTAGIAFLIRYLHNKTYDSRKAKEKAFFEEELTKYGTLGAFSRMAQERCEIKCSRVIFIPYVTIQKTLEETSSDCNVEECCIEYLKSYLEQAEALAKSNS